MTYSEIPEADRKRVKKELIDAGKVLLTTLCGIRVNIMLLDKVVVEIYQLEQCIHRVQNDILEEAAKLLNVKVEQLPSRVEELFNKWKLAKKVVEKNKKIDLKQL